MYLLERIKKKNRKIYDDFFAGLYPSVNKAAEAAGIKHRSTGLAAIKRVWGKSSASDQDAFLTWAMPMAAKIEPIAVKPIADPSLCLSKEVRDFLACWIYYNDSNAGRIMFDLGLSVYDTSLSAAIKAGLPFRQDAIDKLAPWLAKKGFVPSMLALGR